ncbi:MAG: hypothetical protein JRJ29_05230 [Deltaproteobacteria bacterium]|nr:hypothetical protein [Deltaproteobacteria bacterium]
MLESISLDISNLILRVDLSSTDHKLARELAEVFDPFLTGEEVESHELLRVIPVRTRKWKSLTSDRESLMRVALQEPLKKFPFTRDLRRDIGILQKRLRPFAASIEANALLSGIQRPLDLQIYPLLRGWLIRRPRSRESVLFLKARSRRKWKALSIYGAIYFVAANAMPVHDGLMLHGVGVSRLGLGFLFLGSSGGGKTTVARFSRPESVISDDCIIIKRSGTSYFLSPSPFNQHPGLNCMERESLDIGLFLEKDERVFLQEMAPSEACSRILMNHIHFFRYYSSDTVKKTFDLVTGICHQTPFYVLHFTKSPSFWGLLEDRLSMFHSRIKEQDYGFGKKEEKTTLRTSQGL